EGRGCEGGVAHRSDDRRHGERSGSARAAVPGHDRAAREPRRQEQSPLRELLVPRLVRARAAIALVAIAAAGIPVRTVPGRAKPQKAPVGLCTPLKNIGAAKAAGFDYLELGTPELSGLSDAVFDKAVADLKRLGIQVPATNLFLPATLKVTGPD